MISSMDWALALGAAVLVFLARMLAKSKKPPQMPPEPTESPAATHAREAIETAAQRRIDDVDEALKGDDPTESLARLADLANKRRI